jgi:hypothetical protein
MKVSAFLIFCSMPSSQQTVFDERVFFFLLLEVAIRVDNLAIS